MNSQSSVIMIPDDLEKLLSSVRRDTYWHTFSSGLAEVIRQRSQRTDNLMLTKQLQLIKSVITVDQIKEVLISYMNGFQRTFKFSWRSLKADLPTLIKTAVSQLLDSNQNLSPKWKHHICDQILESVVGTIAEAVENYV